MKQLNVLFINVPILPYESIEKCMTNSNTIAHRLEMPLGIMYLSSYLKKVVPGHNVDLLDYSLHMRDINDFDNIAEFIKTTAEKEVDYTPDIIAFSVSFSTSHRFFTETLAELKSQWPESKAIVGGNHASNTLETLLKMDDLDHVARGEGEAGFADYVRQIAEGGEIKVKGIYDKSAAAEGCTSARCEYIEELDEIPYPDWELLDMKAYLDSSGRKRGVGEAVDKLCATIMASRGCVYSCTFCSSHSIFGRTMRYRSVENVLGEVTHLHEKYGVTLFIPEDDLFTANRPRVITLLKALKGLNIPKFELQFPNALSINTLSPAVMDALIDSGMSVACLAIESGSDFVQRKIIKKRCNLEKAKEVVRYLKKSGILIRCYYVLGFPKETIAQLQETVEYAKNIQVDWSAFSIATPLVGSEMYDELVEMKCIEDGPDMWSKSSYAERIYDTPGISAEFLNDYAYRANLDVNFINNHNLVTGNWDKAAEIFADMAKLHPFHIFAWHCLMQAERGRGNHERVAEINLKIEELIKTDKRSEEMFEKYGNLLEGADHYDETPQTSYDNPLKNGNYRYEVAAS